MEPFSLVWSCGINLNPFPHRSFFERRIWSANKVNFDDFQMPDHERKKFCGTFGIVEYKKAGPLQRRFLFSNPVDKRYWRACGVIGAMCAGVYFSSEIRSRKKVLAPGSLGPITKAPDCDICKFCPVLFVFSDHDEASVSLGIERVMGDNDKSPILSRGTKILVWR